MSLLCKKSDGKTGATDCKERLVPQENRRTSFKQLLHDLSESGDSHITSELGGKTGISAWEEDKTPQLAKSPGKVLHGGTQMCAAWGGLRKITIIN